MPSWATLGPYRINRELRSLGTISANDVRTTPMTDPWKRRPAELSVDATGVNLPPPTSYGRAARVLAFSLLSLATSSIWFFSSQPSFRLRETSLTTPSQSAFLDSCPQPTPITPSKHAPMWETLLREATTGEYKNIAVEWLSGAIRVVCVCSQ